MWIAEYRNLQRILRWEFQVRVAVAVVVDVDVAASAFVVLGARDWTGMEA